MRPAGGGYLEKSYCSDEGADARGALQGGRGRSKERKQHRFMNVISHQENKAADHVAEFRSDA